ncbi:hypothetical protein IAR55_005252 [Kwoniella newhampshirensis]|uniref:DUF7721 domain-containing protein n=1 Tax=Kwoniella newhampshirensis TaxID=1651941 RepID=A0AAW0YW18_9TREE
MDFIKKMAEEKLQGAMSGNSGNQQQGQGYDDQPSYGGGGQQDSYGGGRDSYGGQQASYGGQQDSYGGQQDSYGGGQQQSYGNDQEGYGQTGGAQYNRPHGEGGASFGGFGGGGGLPNLSTGAALEAANAHASNGNENSSLFSQAFSYIGNMNKDDTDVDEDRVQQQHQEAYGQGNAGSMSAGAMGSAAAMQALKQFTSGQSGAAGSGGGDMQSKIIGMAMSEAAKLFDQSGGAASGNKQDAVTSAGQTIMKMYLKSQVTGMMGGGNSGGLSSLMGMAQKFM